MAYAVCKNHPFIDGNKRAAVTSMLTMLRLNGVNPYYMHFTCNVIINAQSK
ncbi:MAG: Fic family protein [Clostridiales bacterium]|jgi:prophage maintenance system killer protein|nr:Fic family protein [Clostridiales bacterium]